MYTICMSIHETRYTYGRTCVYNLNYHIVWCVKYRKKVLSPEIEAYLKQVLSEIAQENGFSCVLAEVGEMDCTSEAVRYIYCETFKRHFCNPFI